MFRTMRLAFVAASALCAHATADTVDTDPSGFSIPVPDGWYAANKATKDKLPEHVKLRFGANIDRSTDLVVVFRDTEDFVENVNVRIVDLPPVSVDEIVEKLGAELPAQLRSDGNKIENFNMRAVTLGGTRLPVAEYDSSVPQLPVPLHARQAFIPAEGGKAWFKPPKPPEAPKPKTDAGKPGPAAAPAGGGGNMVWVMAGIGGAGLLAVGGVVVAMTMSRKTPRVPNSARPSRFPPRASDRPSRPPQAPRRSNRWIGCEPPMPRSRLLPIAPAIAVALLAAPGCEQRPAGAQRAVVYVSLDREYAEPLLQRFQEETGIEVEAVYEDEVNRSVGSANRLYQERFDPSADVHWNNEPANTVWLASQGVYAAYRPPAAEDIPSAFRDPEGLWTGFAGRARVIVANTGKLAGNRPPTKLTDFAAWAVPPYRAVVARPVAGTTATHLAVLFALAGPEVASAQLSDLRKRGVSFQAASNSAAAGLVADGQYAVGFTDTDDVLKLQRAGKDVTMVFPAGEAPWEKTYILPNTVALVKGGPNPDAGRKLIDWLTSRRVEGMLAAGPSRQIPLRPDSAPPADLPGLPERKDWAVIDWRAVGAQREAVAKFVREKLLE
jgi:iron(III) transport system substrate-binding protein